MAIFWSKPVKVSEWTKFVNDYTVITMDAVLNNQCQKSFPNARYILVSR